MKKFYLFAFISVFFTNFRTSAQEQLSYLQKADQFYREYQYAKASPIYLRYAESSGKTRVKVLEKLADCYKKMNQYEEAEAWYSKLVANPKANVKNYIYYGEVLKANNHYAEAKKIFQDYASKTGNFSDVLTKIAGCDSAMLWIDNPSQFKLRNEDGINTKLSEFSVFPVGDKIYYTGEPDSLGDGLQYGWTGNSYLKVYSAKKANNNILSEPVLVGPEINNLDKYHIGPVCTNKSGNQWFVTRTSPGKDGFSSREKQKRYITHNLEIFIYSKERGVFKEPKPFPYNNVKKYSIGHAALSADDKVLYFVSNMPGGFGGTDIWYSKLKEDGTWGAPQNAGAKINTKGNEKFPTIALDGTLYYSSDGLPGMGGLDIFSAKGTENIWDNPVNMRYPLNSAGDDFAFVGENDIENGFLSSNRIGGIGNDDIYSFEKIHEVPVILALAGHVFNKKTGAPIENAKIQMVKNEKNYAIMSSDNEGVFSSDLNKNSRYKITGSLKGFYPDSTSVTTEGINQSETMQVALNLEPMELAIGKQIKLKNIYYDFDKSIIRADAAKVLDQLVDIMKENPALKIELASHTDSRGVDIYNLDLSQRRAKAAVKYIVSQGIDSDRLVAKGYGETRLLNKCANGVKCSKADHQLNRRTEFTILAN